LQACYEFPSLCILQATHSQRASHHEAGQTERPAHVNAIFRAELGVVGQKRRTRQEKAKQCGARRVREWQRRDARPQTAVRSASGARRTMLRDTEDEREEEIRHGRTRAPASLNISPLLSHTHWQFDTVNCSSARRGTGRGSNKLRLRAARRKESHTQRNKQRARASR